MSPSQPSAIRPVRPAFWDNAAFTPVVGAKVLAVDHAIDDDPAHALSPGTDEISVVDVGEGGDELGQRMC